MIVKRLRKIIYKLLLNIEEKEIIPTYILKHNSTCEK